MANRIVLPFRRGPVPAPEMFHGPGRLVDLATRLGRSAKPSEDQLLMFRVQDIPPDDGSSGLLCWANGFSCGYRMEWSAPSSRSRGLEGEIILECYGRDFWVELWPCRSRKKGQLTLRCPACKRRALVNYIAVRTANGPAVVRTG
jgi:hypothetical protein